MIIRSNVDLIYSYAIVDVTEHATFSSAPSSELQALPFVRPALMNGSAGAVVAPRGRVLSVIAFTVTNGKIAEIDALLGGGSPCITR